MTIAEFLLARIAEDEVFAGVLARTMKRVPMTERLGPEVSEALVDDPDAYGLVTSDRGSPDRWLRECEAKRRIVVLHPSDDGEWCRGRCIQDVGTYLGDIGAYPWPCPELKALAAVYADHPDYNPGWTP